MFEFVGNHFCIHICIPIQNGMVGLFAQMAELVDALVSNTNVFGRAGSTPALGTSNEKRLLIEGSFFCLT